MLSKSSHQIINGVSITLEASFGCLQNPIRKNCKFVNDDTLMFISGKHIVLYDIIRKRQTYIMKSAEDEVVQVLSFHVQLSNQQARYFLLSRFTIEKRSVSTNVFTLIYYLIVIFMKFYSLMMERHYNNQGNHFSILKFRIINNKLFTL
ncbi:unnamed protein product (macronuclear) [Paramecium tetraurelia]|uniref:Uncharacterized protein n=1 Tax=Paramecium tetraurelia TaxID=5888 RepID=A0DRU5_PARTE|nr:uncharacterized protein GSPATT00019480001 [Paramecium tetraurelia]CAK85762.1 unnamed protein product [Paramecium tetraurelia]|eukprot:XP_001453159.1 hypothetical protein (macronuclear) [Paramecium tetraurelia strain d4-2]